MIVLDNIMEKDKPEIPMLNLAQQQAVMSPILQYNRLLTFQNHLNHLALSLAVPAVPAPITSYRSKRFKKKIKTLHTEVPQWNTIWPKSRRKGGQVRFTAEQTNTLESRFDNEKYLSPNVSFLWNCNNRKKIPRIAENLQKSWIYLSVKWKLGFKIVAQNGADKNQKIRLMKERQVVFKFFEIRLYKLWIILLI